MEKLIREAFIEHLEFDIVVFDVGIWRKCNNCAFKDLESLGINFKPLLSALYLIGLDLRDSHLVIPFQCL